MARYDSTCSVSECMEPIGRHGGRAMCAVHYARASRLGELPKTPERACDICGTVFTPRREGVLRCSGPCSARARSAWHVEQRPRYRVRKNEHMREYAASRKAEKAAYDQLHYAKVRDTRRDQRAAHYAANSSVYKMHAHKRRAFIVGGLASKKDIEGLALRAGGACCYCGGTARKLELDHVIPVSRGGTHTVGNLAMACFRCNRQKSNKTVMEWRVWKVRTAALSSLTIL